MYVAFIRLIKDVSLVKVFGLIKVFTLVMCVQSIKGIECVLHARCRCSMCGAYGILMRRAQAIQLQTPHGPSALHQGEIMVLITGAISEAEVKTSAEDQK